MALYRQRVGRLLELLASGGLFTVLGISAWILIPGIRQGRPPAGVSAPTRPVPLGSATDGSPDASVALIEFADFDCPFCRQFADNTLPALRREYIASGRVIFGFEYFPLDDLHPLARESARAAECARRQNRFWAMHDLLLKGPAVHDRTQVVSHAQALGVDSAAFMKCLESEGAREVDVALEAARAFGITGTPTFFLGHVSRPGFMEVTEVINGAVGLDEFRRKLERVITQRR